MKAIRFYLEDRSKWINKVTDLQDKVQNLKNSNSELIEAGAKVIQAKQNFDTVCKKYYR